MKPEGFAVCGSPEGLGWSQQPLWETLAEGCSVSLQTKHLPEHENLLRFLPEDTKRGSGSSGFGAG